jgi:predicted dehydrogenase
LKLEFGGESTFKVGILGGGSHSAVGRAHISAIRLLGNVQVQAGCFSKDLTRNDISGKAHGVDSERIYPNLERLIEHEQNNIAAIIVLTPTQIHFQDVKKILESGINVICEKSLCVTTKEASILVKIAEENNVKLYVTFNYTGYPMVREIRYKVQKGELGRIHTISAIMPQEGFLKKTFENRPMVPQSWRLIDSDIPTISLDLGVHLANLVTFTTNLEFEEVMAVENMRGNFDVIDDVHVISRMNNSATCNLWYSKTALGKRNGLGIEIYGEEGSIVWSQENPEQFILSNKFGDLNIVNRGTQGLYVANSERYLRFKPGHPSGFIEAFANYYEDVFSEINAQNKQKSEYTFTGVDALKGLCVMEAVSKSSAKHEWTRIDDN